MTDDGLLRVMALFKNVVWQVPCADVTGFTTQPGTMMTVNVAIHTSSQGTLAAAMITSSNFQKLQALFPDLQTANQKGGREWYHDITARIHVATYTSEKQMQREVEAAFSSGWIPQTQGGTAGHVNVGRTATAAVLTGGWSLLLGASRSKDKVTMTFIRSPEWQTKNT